jgi:hypothetical protein
MSYSVYFSYISPTYCFSYFLCYGCVHIYMYNIHMSGTMSWGAMQLLQSQPRHWLLWPNTKQTKIKQHYFNATTNKMYFWGSSKPKDHSASAQPTTTRKLSLSTLAQSILDYSARGPNGRLQCRPGHNRVYCQSLWGQRNIDTNGRIIAHTIV